MAVPVMIQVSTQSSPPEACHARVVIFPDGGPC